MKPDKELDDVWIAEHVMGWMKCTMGHIECAGRYAIQGDIIYIHDRGNYVKEFSPTTDAADAFLVLEKCTRKLQQEDKEETVSVGWDEPYFVVEKTNCSPSLRCEAVTLPSAISQFAQKLFSK